MTTDAVRAVLEQMNAAMSDPSEFDVETFRAAAEAYPGPDRSVAVAAVEDHHIAGPGGSLALRLYRPTLDDRQPVIVYLHGGGYILGGLDSHDVICRSLAVGTASTVCAVDYRLAPEHPFPAALDDVYATVEWIHSEARSTGIDPTRIAIGGDSGGATIAVGAALRCRDTKDRKSVV